MRIFQLAILPLVLSLLVSCSGPTGQTGTPSLPANPQTGSGESQPILSPPGPSAKSEDTRAYMAVKESSLQKVPVSRVVDGDTIEVNVNGTKEKIRLILVDTPETSAPGRPKGFFGTEAKDYAKKRLEGQTVWLEKDVQLKDQYQRWLRYIYLDVKDGKGEFFNGTLVRSGYARMATFPPNVKYVDQIRLWQTEAREKGLGVWKDIAKAFPDRKIEQ